MHWRRSWGLFDCNWQLAVSISATGTELNRSAVSILMSKTG